MGAVLRRFAANKAGLWSTVDIPVLTHTLEALRHPQSEFSILLWSLKKARARMLAATRSSCRAQLFAGLGVSGSQADGVEDGAEVAPVAAHRAFDSGFEFFEFLVEFGLAIG